MRKGTKREGPPPPQKKKGGKKRKVIPGETVKERIRQFKVKS